MLKSLRDGKWRHSACTSIATTSSPQKMYLDGMIHHGAVSHHLWAGENMLQPTHGLWKSNCEMRKRTNVRPFWTVTMKRKPHSILAPCFIAHKTFSLLKEQYWIGVKIKRCNKKVMISYELVDKMGSNWTYLLFSQQSVVSGSVRIIWRWICHAENRNQIQMKLVIMCAWV